MNNLTFWEKVSNYVTLAAGMVCVIILLFGHPAICRQIDLWGCLVLVYICLMHNYTIDEIRQSRTTININNRQESPK